MESEWLWEIDYKPFKISSTKEDFTKIVYYKVPRIDKNNKLFRYYKKRVHYWWHDGEIYKSTTLKYRYFNFNGKEIKLIAEIGAGMDHDDNLTHFNDYNYTIALMKATMVEKGYEPPFIIISDKWTKVDAQFGEHYKKVAIKYAPDMNLSDVEELYARGIEKVVVSEYDYIMSSKWITRWEIVDFGDPYEKRLILTNGEVGVYTGLLKTR